MYFSLFFRNMIGSRLLCFARNFSALRIDNRGIQGCYSSLASQNAAQCASQARRPSVSYGQPTNATHPHLVKSGELLPGLKLEEFRERREKLVARILTDEYVTKNPENSHVVIIPSASVVHMSDKIPYVFRQNTDFLYFTGCQEPDSILVLFLHGEKYSSCLFVRRKDHHSELWDGPRTGVEAVVQMFATDAGLPVGDFEQYVVSHLMENKKSCIWYDSSCILQPELHKKLTNIVKLTNNQTFTSPRRVFHEIRLIKSEAEINLMRKSCEIASAAIAKTIQVSKPGMSEHQLFATVDYESRMNGAEFLAYPPVVAGGSNANVIHYITNNQIVQNGEMVLMDAGCEYHGYTSDITRTWPINGTFTPHQRILYEIVLEVQKTLTSQLAEMPTLDQVFHDMCTLLGQRLQEVGLIPSTLTGEKLRAAAYSYCPHHVSHYLGMDVHDTGMISRTIRIKPGMIVTMEPGIYVNPRNQMAGPEFHGLGIRIEDDVLIQENGPLVLTASCPKEISDIEELAKKNQS